MFQITLTNNRTDKTNYKLMSPGYEQFYVAIESMIKRVAEDKDGDGLIGATFKPGSRLVDESVQEITALILDIDGKQRINGKEVSSVIDVDEFLREIKFQGIAHSSYSHSSAHPKFRVILPLEQPISVSDFHLLWSWMYEKTERKMDPSCKNPSRMYYLPRAPKKAHDAGWPWVKRLQGPLLNMTAVPKDFVSSLPNAPTQNRKSGVHFSNAEPKEHVVAPDSTLEVLLQTPLYKWAQERPQEVGREVWRGLAMNLIAATQDASNDQPEALEASRLAFHEISKADPSRYDYNVCEKTFQQAITSVKKTGPMTFAHMQMNGAPDDICNVEEKAPIVQAKRQARKTEAKLELKDKEIENPDKVEFKYTTNDFLFDMMENKWYVHNTVTNHWDGPYPDTGFKTWLITKGLADKAIKGFIAGIKSFQKKEALFDSDETLITRDGINIFNTYKPSIFKPVSGTWTDYELLLLNLVGKDLKALDYTLQWLAAPLQSLVNKNGPRKMGTALVFQGEQGSGKGTLERSLRIIYGSENVVTIGQQALDGRFNGELAGKLFLIANEVVSNTNRSGETANKIKPWISDPTIVIEAKQMTTVNMPNNFNVIFTSNDDRPVLLEKTDRRFSVFNSIKLPADLSERLWNDLNGNKKQLAAFYDYLLNISITIKNGQLYHTSVRDHIILSSAHSDEKFVETIKLDGWLTVSEPWVSAGHENSPRKATEDNGMLSVDTLNKVYQYYCQINNLKARSQKLPGILKAEFPESNQILKKIGGIAKRVWIGIPMVGEATKSLPDEVTVESLLTVPVVKPSDEGGSF